MLQGPRVQPVRDGAIVAGPAVGLQAPATAPLVRGADLARRGARGQFPALGPGGQGAALQGVPLSTGYVGGLDMKARLLRLEGALTARV